MEELESGIQTLESANNALRNQINSLNVLKSALISKKNTDFYTEKAALETQMKGLLSEHDLALAKFNDFTRFMMKVRDLEARNRRMEKELSRKAQLSGVFSEIKALHEEKTESMEERVRLKLQVEKTKEVLTEKTAELMSLKHRFFNISIERKKFKELKAQKQVVRARSNADVLFLGGLLAPTKAAAQEEPANKITPPRLIPCESAIEMPPMQKHFKSMKVPKNPNRPPEKVLIRDIKVHSDAISRIANCNESPLILTFSKDRTFRCLNVSEKHFISIGSQEKHPYMYTNGDIFGSQLIAVSSTEPGIEVYSLSSPEKPTITLKGHKSAVTDVKFLGGNSLVSVSMDSTLRIWDLSSGATIQANDFPSFPLSLARLNDFCLMSGHSDGQVILFDPRIPLEKVSRSVRLYDERQQIKSVRVSSSGKYAVTLSHWNSARLLDTREFKTIEVASKELHSNIFLESIDLWLNESFLVGGGLNGELLLIDSFMKSNAKMLSRNHHSSIICSSVYSPFTGLVYTGDCDGTLTEWEIRENHIFSKFYD